MISCAWHNSSPTFQRLFARRYLTCHQHMSTSTRPPLQTSLAPIARLLVGPDLEPIPIHTHILLARCPYIKALVNSNMKESLQGSTSFHLPDLTPAGVEQVVQYMYSASFTVSAATVVEVMEAAKFLLMTGVEQRCADYVAQHLDPTSAVDLLDTAMQMQSVPLQDVVLGYCCAHAQVCGWGQPHMSVFGHNVVSPLRHRPY